MRLTCRRIDWLFGYPQPIYNQSYYCHRIANEIYHPCDPHHRSAYYNEKTLLISLLSCGLAAAATIQPEVRLNFDKSATATDHDNMVLANSISNSSFTITKVNDKYMQYTEGSNGNPAADYLASSDGHAFRTGENNAHFTITGDGLNLSSDFTLSFAVQRWYTEAGYDWDNFLAVKANNKVSYFQNDSNSGLYFAGGALKDSTGGTTGSFAANTLKNDAFTHIALVYSAEENLNGSFTMYVEGEKVKEWSSGFGNSGAITLEVGGYGSHDSSRFYMDEVGLYTTALTQQQIKDNLVGKAVGAITTSTPGTDSIPEPTTATLSLLALAGLAARRRRK